MSYTREEWSQALLQAIGNNSIALSTIEWIVAWTSIETSSTPGAQYNLLNTTEPYTPGVVSDFNSAGVKNYDSFTHGIQANAKVLMNGYYPDLYTALKTNNYSFLFNNAVMINPELSKWGTGPVFNTIISRIGQHMTDEFPGTSELTPPPPALDPVAVAIFQSVVGGSLPTDTGIAEWWFSEYKAGNFHGPALSKEWTIGDIAYQPFGSRLVEWSHTSHSIETTKAYL